MCLTSKKININGSESNVQFRKVLSLRSNEMRYAKVYDADFKASVSSCLSIKGARLSSQL